MSDIVLPDTPVMKQYATFKKEHPDKVLLFRMGDFFEMFGDDAVKSAEILHIQLTSRDKNATVPLPMCGIPAHAADKYIYTLISRGIKVAVCDQIEEASASKGIVKRGVTRILTPGTVFEENEKNAGKNNFICAIDQDNEANLAATFCDCSTGEIEICVLKPEDDIKQLFDLLSVYSPTEILLKKYKTIDETHWQYPLLNYFKSLPDIEKRNVNIEYPDDYYFDPDACRKKLLEHLNVNTLTVYGLPEYKCVFSSMGVVIHYLYDTQKETPVHVSLPKLISKEGFMHLDSSTLKNLEIFQNASSAQEIHTLFWVLNKTSTGMGARKLRRMMQLPLTVPAVIQKRQDAIQELIDKQEYSTRLSEMLKSCGDIERIAARLSLPGYTPRNAVFLRNALYVFPKFAELLSHFSSELLAEFNREFDTVADALDLLEKTLTESPSNKFEDGDVIAPGINEELDKLKDLKMNGKQKIAEMETIEKEKTGISHLKIRFNKVFGYYIEISNASKHLAPEYYTRRQTLTNAERFITQELKELEENLIHAESKINRLEIEIFNELHEKLKQFLTRLLKSSGIIATTDALLSMAKISAQNGYHRPQIHSDPNTPLTIKTGRHPVVEIIQQYESPFVPNDLEMLPGKNFIHLITGPNMGGKSTFMRQSALIVLMAHIGCFVPAESASMPVFDRIFTRVGASDNLTRGQSTFMVEMNETASILNQLTPRSLVILDEIGRGTGTYDGMALARAITEYLHSHKTLTLFATHYHELAKLEEGLSGLKNFRIAVNEDNRQIVFLKKVLPGIAGKSYGIHVAQMAGLPAKLIDRANELLDNLETDTDEVKDIDDNRLNAKNRKNIGSITRSQKSEKNGKSIEQLDFYSSIEHPILDLIRKTDVNKISPIEALNFLNTLKEELKE